MSKTLTSFKVLSIGNSFSDDSMKFLYPLAKAAGAKDIVLGILYIPGCPLSTHWQSASADEPAYWYRVNTGSGNGFVTAEKTVMLKAIKDYDWDIITMQQASGFSGVEDSYNTDLTNLIDYVEKNKTNPNSKLVWNMTWAYQQNANHGDYVRYNNSQSQMYEAITNSVKSKVLILNKFDKVIPSGTAIQNLRTSVIGDNLTLDGYHLSNEGCFTVGLQWISTLLEADISKISYIPENTNITQEQAELAKKAVYNATQKPFSVTNL